MIIITDYRLEKQGGVTFLKDKRACKLPNMRGDIANTRMAGAENDGQQRRKDKIEDTAAEMRKMQANPS